MTTSPRRIARFTLAAAVALSCELARPPVRASAPPYRAPSRRADTLTLEDGAADSERVWVFTR